MFKPEDKNKKEEMTRESAFKIIDGWGDDMEVRLVDGDWQDVKNEIWMAVKKERLIFNSSDETFTYTLKKPIKDKEGNEIISIIKIRESDMEQKRDMSKHKNDIDTVAAMMMAYCTRSDDNEIEPGFLTRIKDRDMQIIQAVILGFFVQAVPSVR